MNFIGFFMDKEGFLLNYIYMIKEEWGRVILYINFCFYNFIGILMLKKR